MAKSTTTNIKSPAMEKLTESVGELKVFQLGTKGQTPGEKGRGGRSSKKNTPKVTKRVSLKSPTHDNRRATRANDQKMAKKARHKKNRASIKSEASTKTEKSSRKEVVDFSQLDAMILAGQHKGFLGKKVTEEEDANKTDTIKVKLLMNSRMTAAKVPKVIDVKAVDVGEPDSDDMIAFASTNLVDDETEDKDLLKHENETWECPKCNQENKNDAGYCANIIDGKLCGGTKKAEKILDWMERLFWTYHQDVEV